MDSHKRNIVIAVMVAMFLGAVEGTVVTTAIPTIVKDLNGFELISWVFSVYLLASAISTPIYGKLSDLYGRKSVLVIGIIIFLIGSSLCGISQNMYQLIAFRVIQGIGAGSIFTVTSTIVGDVFSITERAKVQGWLGTVWGIASLAGPFLGGFLIDYLSWHWIFFINLPFGIVSIILLQRNFTENFEKKRHKIDFAGIIVLSAAILILMYIAMSGGKSNSWLSVTNIISILTAAILLIVFYLIEKKTSEPILPFEIFTRVSTFVNINCFFIAAVLIGTSVYMPLYVQNILGYNATMSGLAMASMSVSWLLSSVILGKAIPIIGERIVTVVSCLLLLFGCMLLPLLGVNSPLFFVVILAFILGLGFGGAFTTLTIIIQESVAYNKRGAAIAANSLVRTLGQTIGISVFGSVFNIYIVKYFRNIGINNIEPNSLYSSSMAKSSVSMEQVISSQNSGLHVIFIILIAIALICTSLSFLLPNSLKDESSKTGG